MKKIFCTALLMTTAFVGQSAPIQNPQENVKLEEVVLTLPLEELIIISDGIFVKYEGSLLNVHALEKVGEKWLVRAGAGRYFKCLNGHTRFCPSCGGCGAMGCIYYCDGYCSYS